MLDCMGVMEVLVLVTVIVFVAILAVSFLTEEKMTGPEVAYWILCWAAFLWALLAAFAALKLFGVSLPVWDSAKYPFGAASSPEAIYYTLLVFSISALLFGMAQIIASLCDIALASKKSASASEESRRLLEGELFREWLRARNCEPAELRDQLQREIERLAGFESHRSPSPERTSPDM